MSNRVSEAIRTARKQRGVSQIDLAKAIGVSQATISKVEQGHEAKDSILKAIFEYLRITDDVIDRRSEPAPISAYRVTTASVSHGSQYEMAIFSAANWGSGDVIATFTSPIGTRILLADSAGHGPAAQSMSMALAYGFKILNRVVPDPLFSCKLATELLITSVDKTWDGQPSLTVVQLTSNEVTMSSVGMPKPWIFKRGTQNKYQQIAPGDSSTVDIKIPDFEIALIFSDGFLEGFEKLMKVSLKLELKKTLENFNGDVTSVMKNLHNKLMKYKDQLVEDDMIALLIGKKVG